MQPDEGAQVPGGVPGPAGTDLSDPLIGRILDGRYRISRRIGRGGMASIYEAADLRLDRTVAVKIMHAGLGNDHDFAARFVREARAAAQISHPNVVAVYDQGEDNGVVFLAMELITGRTLRDVIRQEAPLSPARAMAFFEPVVAALAAAHRNGLIHRDIKPENVLIAEDGRVKVADFGLAKAVSADTQHTSTGGVLIGTVSYLAPELVVDGRADARADVYAAGVMLYEMLTGSKPHDGESPIAVAYKHVHEDVPVPSTRAPRVPAYVDALVARATSRDRTVRPADADVLLHQVKRVTQALAEGLVDDPELTADLLPPAAAPAPPAPVTVDPMTDTQPNAAPSVEPASVADAPTQLRPSPARVVPASAAPVAAGVFEEPAILPETTGPVLPVAVDQGTGAPTDVVPPAPPAAPEDTFTGYPVEHQDDADDFDLSIFAPDESYTPAPTATVMRGHPDGSPPPWSDFARSVRDETIPIMQGAPPAPPAKVGRSKPPKPPKPPRRPRSWRGPLLIALAVLLAAGIASGAWWYGVGRYTKTPGVIGMAQADAEAKIKAAGLVPAIDSVDYSETVPKGMVIDSDPGPGTKILDGATVSLTVSKGPERYQVPKLVGLTEDKAQDRIAANHLVFGHSTYKFSEKVKKGRVIACTPKAGTSLKRNSTINLVVSKGRKPIHFADWTGKDAATALRALEAKGLKVDASQEAYSDTVPAGSVISQTPRTGVLYKGDTITLIVSKGPEPVTIPTDGLVGVPVDQAKATLEGLGFVVKIKKNPDYVGLNFVHHTDPAPGTSVPKGSVVTLYII